VEESLIQLAEELKSQVLGCDALDCLREAAIASVEVKISESLMCGRMTLLHYRMFGGSGDEIYRAAAAVEFMILALDIIDDLQDDDHKDMPWNHLPKNIAMNLALAFLTLSHETLLRCRFPVEHVHKAAEFLSRQVITATNGQTLDLLNSIATEEEYMIMVKQKSAALLVCACMVGVILATGEVSAQVEEYALEIGISAQIKNDFRDLLSWDRKSDFLHRKRTLPMLFLLSSITEEEDRWVADYFEGRLALEDVLDRSGEFADLVERTGTPMYTSFRERSSYYHFREILDGMELESPWKQALIAAAE
jgi:competence protein ComQ